MITFVIAVFAFSNAYFLIGQNQIQFDALKDSEKPMYVSFIGSLQFIYLMALGEVDEAGNYGNGTGGHYFTLWILFMMTSFTLIVHMLNMLIAIMGNTFGENQAEQS